MELWTPRMEWNGDTAQHLSEIPVSTSFTLFSVLGYKIYNQSKRRRGLDVCCLTGLGRSVGVVLWSDQQNNM